MITSETFYEAIDSIVRKDLDKDTINKAYAVLNKIAKVLDTISGADDMYDQAAAEQPEVLKHMVD